MDKNNAPLQYSSHFVNIYGSKMHYIEQGEGDPILFLHGIPSSSYVWRHVIPHLASLGRCIAPDLIGLGKSDKPTISYSIEDHIQYIDKLIETLNLKNITFILHGWGSIIGFDYAMKHEKNCKGLVFYEAYLRAFNEEDLSLPYQEQMYYLQEQLGHSAIPPRESWIDKMISQSMMYPLSKEEMARYCEPFAIAGSEKPILTYLRESMQNQKHINDIIHHYSEKLKKSMVPKLMLYAVPGFITTIATVIWAKENFPNLEINEIGEAMHYAQENNPTLMGESISVWMQGIEQAEHEKIL